MKLLSTMFTLFLIISSVYFFDSQAVNAEGETSTPAPVITLVSPSTINQNDLVEIIGENFGSVHNGSVITPSGEQLSINTWTETSIKVSANIHDPNDWALIVRTDPNGNGSYLYSNEFPLKKSQQSPTILSISPSTINPQGDTVTITGENFGESQSTYNGYLYDDHHVQGTHQILNWSDTAITAVINFADRDWSLYSSPRAGIQVRVSCLDEDCKNGDSPTTYSNRPADEYWSNSYGIDLNVEVCTENEWTCDEWSECSTSGSQSRTCTQTFFCGNAESSESPSTTQSCTYEEVFTDTLPVISSISPQTITPGNTISITGSNFGSSRGSSKLVNGSGSSLSGTILSWTDSQITYATSTYYDTTSKKIGVKKCESYTNCADPVYGSYIYIQPSISSLSTYTGAVGDTVRINGKYLKSSNLTSDSSEYYYINAYFNGTEADIINWENTYIDVSVPDGATDGVVSIKLTADGVSTPLTASSPSFDVLEMLSDDPYSAYQDYFKQISIPQAWGLVQDRREIIVAVIDDGVYNNHPEFSDKLWQNTDEIIGNAIDDDKNGYIDDRYGWDFIYDTDEMSPTGSHGTQVAGIIGASTNNGEGIAGVNWNVEIMPLIVFDYEGGSSSEIVNQAIYYAVDNGAEVINLSLGTSGVSGYSTGFDAGIKYAYDHNVLVVASAGNGDTLGGLGYNLNSVPQSPVCNDGDENWVIGVGAVNSNNYRTTWTNYGANCVDIYAPGEDILSTTIPVYSPTLAFYEYADGTSFSAPIVTGIVSLLKAAYPTITSQEAINLLISNADGGVVNAYKTLKANFTPANQQISSSSSSSSDSTNSSSADPSSASSSDDGLTSSTFQSRDSVLTREITLLNSVDTSLSTRLLGKILLQVESRGEAWYVNPLDSKKYYMGRPWDAFQLMRSLGLGITDSDLALIPTDEDAWDGNEELIERLKGRILLQVESRGQAWYINPDDGKRYYMGLPSDAFSLMRSLGLGITNNDLRKIDVESF